MGCGCGRLVRGAGCAGGCVECSEKMSCVCLENGGMSLASVKVGGIYCIVGVDLSLDSGIRRRLFELGFVVGAKIKVLRRSFLGKTLLISINSFTLSLREVEKIYVVECT